MVLGDIANGKKVHTIRGGHKGKEDQHVRHTMHILSMAISSDGKYLVSGSISLSFHYKIGLNILL